MILLVEDNPNARLLFATMLSGLGHEVVECENGAEAVELVDKQRFDLIVTDLRMPRLDGFGLISHIRSKLPLLPMILVSGYISTDAVENNNDKYLEIIPKPVDRGHLIASVNRFLPIAAR